MDPLDPLPNKQIMEMQSSAQMIEQPFGIETAVIPEPSRRVLYFLPLDPKEKFLL